LRARERRNPKPEGKGTNKINRRLSHRLRRLGTDGADPKIGRFFFVEK
jgi:hypothetical protein